MEFYPEDLRTLRSAKNLLETRGFAQKAASMLGMPVEKTLGLLPGKWQNAVNSATRKALHKALDFAVFTMGKEQGAFLKKGPISTERFHKILVAISGACGGAFGLPALGVELPFSTLMILRSIADIARSEGEDIARLETRLACMEVFALGGSSKRDDAIDTGYFAVRGALAQSVSGAMKHIAEKGVVRQSTPALVRFIREVSARFGILVSDKIAVQALPMIGAAGGAGINALFIDHFQNIARAHFIIRRLERKYGEDRVRLEYDRLADS